LSVRLPRITGATAQAAKRSFAGYSGTCLKRVWRVQRFSSWMTPVLHRVDTETKFDRRRRVAELQYLVSSRAAMTSLAENYAGLPLEWV